MSRTSAFPSTPAPKTVSSVHRIIVRQLHRFAFPLALLPILLLSRTTWAQTAGTAPAEQKVKKVFYPPKTVWKPCTRRCLLRSGWRCGHSGGASPKQEAISAALQRQSDLRF